MGQPFKIDKSNVEEILSLSPMQEGMLFHYLRDPDSEQYFEQLSLSISGKINIAIFEKAWEFVTSKNEMLRTLFRWEKLDKPIQIILKKHNTKILTHDFCCANTSESIKKLYGIKIEDKNNKFDLREVPFRVTLCKLGKNQYEMIITNHHILYDGWSTGIILQDFLYAYDVLGKNENLEKIETFKVKQFIKYLNEKNKKLERLYWEKYLANFEGEHFLQMNQEDTSVRELEQYDFEIREDSIKEIDLFIKDKKMTLAELVYCAWGILLQKYTNSRDVVFGTTVSGRNTKIKGMENAVGLFINTLPLRIESDGNKSVSQLLQDVKDSVRERELYETTALVDIKKYSDTNGNKDLFDSLVVVENYPLDNLLTKKGNLLDVVAYSIEEQTNYPLTLSINKSEHLNLILTYDKAFMTKEYIKNMSEHFINIIKSIIKESEKNIDQIDILTEREKKQILYDFNNTSVDYFKDKTIQELFEAQVEKTPNNIAVVFEDKELTYRELNEKSNSLAKILRNKGVKADSIVGIMVERSLEMVIGILGILKAGGAYLPIDTSYPKERIEYMLKDSKSSIVLTTKNLLDNIQYSGECVDLLDNKLFEGDLSNLENINNPNDLIYVIYTSGTTGNPKGTIVKHHSFTNLMQWYDSEFKISEKDNVLLVASVSFDLAQKNIYAPLIVGGKLVLANKGIINYEKVNKIINENKITIINCAPSMFNPIVEFNKETNYADLKSLKYVFLGGEPINSKKLSDWINSKEYSCEIVNTYGPTECTDIATFYRIGKEEISSIPIGKPINNVKLYVLDKDKKLVPVGVQGELYIAGDGISRGYLNRAELTAEKFVDNPFEVSTKMYKTGDSARWLPDGNVEFLGRIDNQVKIRGFRVELGEIENRLLQHEEVKEVVVVIKENEENDKYLCAYVICDKEINELNLKNYLKVSLPDYMIPTYFVQLESMPITTNGKLDRRSLPEPNLDVIVNEYEAPRNALEETLSKIWSEILGIERIGINDNFFELGGHSLKATLLMSKVHKTLNKEVPLKELFKLPTIRELSKYLEYAEENLYSEIEKVEEKEYYEASSAQKRVYMLQQFDKDNIAYNMPAVFEVEGQIEKGKVEDIFKKLVTRHEALKTYFEAIDDEIVQKIDNSCEFKLAEKKEKKEIESIIKKFVRPFELEKAPLFRVELVELKEKTYLLIDMHHIISDGVSMNMLIKEFTALYNGEDLEPLKLQYKDFAAWQNNLLKSEEMKNQEEYWINRFSDEIPVLNMPTDYERPPIQSFEGDSISFEVDEKTTKSLRKLAKETGTTMYMILLSAFNILLSKYSGQEDIVIGTPIAGRPHADLQNIIGMFVNTLALRNKPEGSKNYIDFLKEVKENSLKAYENQSYQLEALVEKLDVRRDISRNPLFDVMFNMVDTVSDEDIKLNDIILKQYNSGSKIPKFDLTLNALESDNKLNFTINYRSKLFKKETIERLSSHYIRILESIVSDKEIKLCEVDLLSKAERNQILYEFNDTKIDYPKDKTIQELFELQVEKTPDNTAVVFEDKKLTYRKLNEKANSLARALRNTGIKSDSIVGIMIERSFEMIVGIMGVLKAGGAYLPLDPKLPKERINYMIADSGINVLVTSRELTNNIEFDGEILDIKDDNLFKVSKENLEIINKCSDLAYIIYTSGTTGNPKGVMVEHNNVVRLMFNEKMPFEFSDKDVWTMFHSYCFDFSVWEMYGALLYGGKLVMVPELITKDFEEYLALLKREKVTVLNQTPTAFYNLMSIELDKKGKDLSLRYIVFGGEALNPQMLKEWKQRYNETKIINMYGITETTVHVTYKEIGIEEIEKGISNIGKPIPTLTTYVMNENLNIQPIGVPGELCVGGDGVARGYLNRDELTEQKFVMNPYIKNERIYRSGDLVRLLENGDLEYLGRIDNQVKIRGFRIELGEIENRLLQHESVKEVVVVVKENEESEKYICAYVVCDKEISELNLKSYLKISLPEYMIPTYFVQLESMPITTNGKLDRRALTEANLDVIVNEYEAPRNELEKTLSKIWSEILGIERIGINDNFFELGGHSLKATLLMSKIHKRLNKEIPLKELFKLPTIKELSKSLESAEENPYSEIEKVEEKEYYEASSAQKRMYMLQQFDKDSTVYNMPAVFELEGEIHKDKIEETFRKLTERHEALRTYFEALDGEIVQKIDNTCEFQLINRKINEEIESIISEFIRSFDLEKAPLFRVELVENKGKNYLLIDMHHIISDGVSMNILIKEFTDIYNGKNLELLKFQYKDFAAWQNSFLKSEEMKKQEEYWINNFSDEIPVLSMPTDYERPVMQSFDGDSVSFEINETTTLKLRKLTEETGTTMHMALLSVFNILLSKYSGQEDIVIGTPIAGRPHADLQNIMGMFVNTLALRNKPEGHKKYIDFLKEVKENSLKAYENGSYQLETLVETLDIRRDISRNPLFDVMFNMINTEISGDIKLDDIVLKQYNNGSKISKFDLTLNVLENDIKLSFNIEYCSKLFKKETIERLSAHYVRTLNSIVNNREIKLYEIDLLSEQERNQILYEFNDTDVDYPKDKTIHELFEAQVEKTPDNIAVVFEDKKLTYRELNKKSNSLARVLRVKGVRANSIVGIMIERSLDMIVGIMGILKSGGAYLPIDPNYPKERIEYMLKDSGSKLLLSKNILVENIDFNGKIIDLFNEDLFKSESSNLEKINSSSNLAYVIYTSGTTGNPKGVMIEHKQVNNFIKGIVKETNLNLYSNILCITTICFDIFGLETLAPLTKGLNIVVANRREQIDGDKLSEVITKNNVEVMQSTPSRLKALLENKSFKESLRDLKLLLIGGEEVDDILVMKLHDSINAKIYNVYGPSETTIWSTAKELKKNEKVTIGKPISNTKIYILNKNNKLLPVGIAGELCISGDGLSRGYLNRAELTAEKFIENPFEAGVKMYKTGDSARWLPDGNIEFLGRIDNQVKIRGFRIELSEIENKLLQHEEIKEAAVLISENKESEKYICAYVVCDKEINELNLKSYLKISLPEYMIPTYFAQLESMPITTNGKLDRRALPKPNLDVIVNEYEAPRNELEETLSKIWSEILGIERIGINDNFFELGGHSLKATLLMSKIHKVLNKEVPLKELFKLPTIKELSNYLESAEENPYSEIEKVEEKQYYESSSAQKRMYMLQQFDKYSIAYNMPAVFELEGKVDKVKIEETFRKLTGRHEALRTYFETFNGEIIQKLQNNYIFKLEHRNEKRNVEDIINDFVRPFDLEKAPLFRVELVENKEKTYLLIDMHHIISDGISMSILTREFTEVCSGKILEPLKLQYKDFAAWQNNFLKSEGMKKQEEYWINRFSDEIPVLNMPTDCERPAMQSFEGDSVSFEVNEDITLKLRKLTRETGTTMHMALLSAFNILLSKYSGQEDIVIGTPIAGRAYADLQNIMGMFVNTLALRNKPEGSKKYIDFLKEVKENSLKAYENGSYQLEALVEKLDVRRDTSRNPLFDVMFNVVDTVTGEDIKLDDIILKQYNNGSKISKFDLTLNALENDNKLNFTVEYCSKLFKKETIERLSAHYVRILNSIVNNVEVKLNEVNLLSEAEKNQILYEFNDTKVDYPKDKTIHGLFEAQVEKTSDNIAIIFENKKLTYRELNEKANSLARVLRDKGVKANSIVGIMVERSLEMIVGIMAVLKAGGAYLPIDPTYPNERVKYMLADSKSKTLLSAKNLVSNIEFDGEVIDLFNDDLFNGDFSNLEEINDSNDLAYVIYTSGTTGDPKGTLIEHRNVINVLNWFINKYNINSKHKIINLTEYIFDPSIEQIFATLITGASLYIPKKEIILQNSNLIRYIKENNINIMNSVPAIAAGLLESSNKIDTLNTIIVGGDTLGESLKNRLLDYGYKLFNHYGPTETTIDVLSAKCEKGIKRNIIGSPIDNTKVYIINDKNNNFQPIGILGELCISGDGLSRGYLNKSELTREKFVDNPFEVGMKMYKTGDLARWLPDGNIEFLGRIDNQVKIRGFRIELGEIENRLLEHESIKEATVIVKENKENEKYICAYVVSEKNPHELDLKGHLKETLPEYMVPTYFVGLEKIPLTANGKLDRKALPEPNMDATLAGYEAPRNEVEETLAKIWSEVLCVEKVGINDNFFDLGGHSLKATMLMSKIHKELNKEVPLKELFKSPTIKDLSKYIESVEENLYSKIEKVEEKEYYETSSAQKRMYMLQQFDKNSTAYNMPSVFELEGKVDKDKIEETFRKITERHEALRTYFETFNGEIIQRLQKNYIFKLEHRNEKANIKNIINKFVKPFDLGKAPLFRVELIENKEKGYLLIDMHHIISDGLSMGILINEFTEVYSGENLEPLKLQYKDFAAWQNKFLKSEEVKKQEEYWLNVFSDEVPVLNMPTDYERPVMQSFEGDSVSFKADENTTLKLRKLTKKTGTTMHMVLLSAFNVLLSKYSGQEDIVIGTPIAGRAHADLQNIMGMFVNTLALRNKPEGSKKYIDFLKEVKENSLKAYENGSYQLEALVEKLDVRRDISRNPLFDVMFNVVDTVTGEDIKLDDIILKQYNNGSKISKFDLTLNAVESDNKLNFTVEYCSKLFKKETIERLSAHYVRILNSIVNNVEVKLNEVNLLSEAEKNQILYEFNDTKVDYLKDKTMHELFEAQVEKTPDNIAVVFENKKLTYRELNERANSLARVLRDKGVKAGSIVGIMVEKSLEMIVGIMGILKAGGAYLPIDHNYPKERIEYMLKDSESNILLSKNTLVETIEFDRKVINLFNEELFTNESSNLEKINNSTSLAYVIYTSGTTGNPKGVMCEHKNVVRLVKNANYIEFKDDDKILQTGSMVFDASTFEVWGALLNGLELYLAKNEIIIMPENLEEFVNKNNISILWLTSELFNQIAEENISVFKDLRYLLVGGDVLSPKYISLVRKQFKNLKILNGYGPTENTTFSTTYLIEKKYSSNIPIGKPIANSKAYIVDENYKLNPIGVYGELCVSGDGLARGYLNNPELTAEKFIDNPFEAGTKMYKTGDLARWLPDGNIEFLGRIDNQVKIRGFRIELGEIENKILQHESIKEAVVLVKKNKGNEKYICAYVVSEKNLEELSIKSYLKETLPEYMVPAYFVQLEKIPVTSNGKVDRRALEQYDKFIDIGTVYEAPRNEIEEKLAYIWSEVLGVDKIGINDNFFELGGHSLKATILMNKIHKVLNVEVPLKELLKNPNIKGIGEYIKNSSKNKYVTIEKCEEKEHYQLSRAQQRLYILNQKNPFDISYNMPIYLVDKGNLDLTKLEKVINRIVDRHEILRTRFDIKNGELIQIIEKKSYINIDIIRTYETQIENIIKENTTYFDIKNGPLIKIMYVSNHLGMRLLIVNMHHIISDGISLDIFKNELITLFKGNELPPLKIQYKDFAAWQNKRFNHSYMNDLEEYWMNRMKNFNLTKLSYKSNYKREGAEGEIRKIIINKESTERISNICKRYSITKFAYITSIITYIIGIEVNQDDIVVGIPVAGRNHFELTNLIGLFLNVLPLRVSSQSCELFQKYIMKVNQHILEDMTNQDYPYEELFNRVNENSYSKVEELFSIMINYIPYTEDDGVRNEFIYNNLQLEPYYLENTTAKYDITFYIKEEKEYIHINLVNKINLFENYLLDRIVDSILNVNKLFLEDNNITISDLNKKISIKQNPFTEDFEEFDLEENFTFS